MSFHKHFLAHSMLTCKVHYSEAVTVISSPGMVQIASSSPPNGTLLLFLHRSCLSLSDAGFRTPVLHVSEGKKKRMFVKRLLFVIFHVNHYDSTGTKC